MQLDLDPRQFVVYCAERADPLELTVDVVPAWAKRGEIIEGPSLP